MSLTMREITGIDIDYSQLPKDYNSSMHPEAVKYRTALARASNAIEGVILTEEDKAFLDSIPLDLDEQKLKEAILNHLASQKKDSI